MKTVPAEQVFSALANEIRLRCLYLVYNSPDVCVCEVVAALKISQPAASKALGALRGVGLLDSRRDANWTYYRMRSDMPAWLERIVVATMEELDRTAANKRDLEAIRSLALRTRSVA